MMATDPLSLTMAALADPTRRVLLVRLWLGEISVTEPGQPFAEIRAARPQHGEHPENNR